MNYDLQNRQKIKNKRNKAIYEFVPSFLAGLDDKQIQNLVCICNESLIYELFRLKLNGNPYSENDAKQFISWADEGWNHETHFVFVLLDTTGKIVGTISINSANRNMAEIGYWCSHAHRGLMTDALSCLKMAAQHLGFTALCARVRKNNTASVKVLERNEFILVGDWPEDSSRSFYQFIFKS
jgi:RimJ/RimL family protein N-acetyltransferase